MSNLEEITGVSKGDLITSIITIGIFILSIFGFFVKRYLDNKYEKNIRVENEKLEAYKQLHKIFTEYEDKLDEIYAYSKKYVNNEIGRYVGRGNKSRLSIEDKYRNKYKEIINQNMLILIKDMTSLSIITDDIETDIRDIQTEYKMISELLTYEQVEIYRYSDRENGLKNIDNKYNKQKKKIENILVTINKNMKKINK